MRYDSHDGFAERERPGIVAGWFATCNKILEAGTRSWDAEITQERGILRAVVDVRGGTFNLGDFMTKLVLSMNGSAE
jgi:hypothetical protein